MNQTTTAQPNVCEICREVLRQTNTIRGTFKPFIKWHEAYAYINKEAVAFKLFATRHQDISSAKIIMCENCGCTYDDVFNECPLCGWIDHENGSAIHSNLVAVEAVLDSMRNILLRLGAQSLLASSECMGRKELTQSFNSLLTHASGFNRGYDLSPEETILKVFHGAVEDPLKEFHELIKIETAERVKLESLCNLITAGCVLLIIRLDYILQYANKELEHE